MGYDSKGLVPDWCKCKRKRDEWERRCLYECFSRYFLGHGRSTWGQRFWFNRVPVALIGFFVGRWWGLAVSLIFPDFLGELCIDGYTPQEWGSMSTAFLFCRFVCHDKMLDICEPGRYTNWREHAYGIGYRRF